VNEARANISNWDDELNLSSFDQDLRFALESVNYLRDMNAMMPATRKLCNCLGIGVEIL